MREATNKQEPSSKEGGEMKAGDFVWVKCKVIEPCENLMKVTGSGDENWFWAGKGQCRLVEPIAKEPTEAQKIAERTMKAIWAANDAVNRTPVVKESLTTESNSPKIPNSSSEALQVGDAVRFVLPGHTRHGTEGVLKSIHHGPKNAYLFVSNCGQFHRYCTIAELEHYDQADPIDVNGSMASLDGADTIQEGDLQWTDRDGKYRLCNFTIGMRVHDAIQRGKSHGEKWVFYRKFREVGE
jgi:hypothetical protein